LFGCEHDLFMLVSTEQIIAITDSVARVKKEIPDKKNYFLLITATMPVKIASAPSMVTGEMGE
jgi:hypothetical protein